QPIRLLPLHSRWMPKQIAECASLPCQLASPGSRRFRSRAVIAQQGCPSDCRLSPMTFRNSSCSELRAHSNEILTTTWDNLPSIGVGALEFFWGAREPKMRRIANLGVALATMFVFSLAGLAQARAQLKGPQEASRIEKANQWTVGLAGGLPEGTILRFATEIARNVNNGEQLRVLPVVTPGATENVLDLLYLKGIDIAITHSDVFEHFRTVDKISNVEKRINYISALYISELHVLVRPEINSFHDLEGKKVSFNTQGAGTSVTGPILFQRLGVK